MKQENYFFKLFRERTKILDVRAPSEYQDGHLPGSVNLCILDDEQRSEVGKCYKAKGKAAALELGHSLVSGEDRDKKLNAWLDFLKLHENSVITCLRGGLRSKICQEWLREAGVNRDRIPGGYKSVRNFLIRRLDQFPNSLLVLAGPTGSAKTELLRKYSGSVLDIEKSALHRGSAFGGVGRPQPAQASFENDLAYQSLFWEGDREVLVEDESRCIGRCVQPERLFTKLRSSSVVLVEESFENRVEHIFKVYIKESAIGQGFCDKGLAQYESFHSSLKQISKKLGGLVFDGLRSDLDQSKFDYKKGILDTNRIWISKLLKLYYDPLYLHGIERKKDRIIFSGDRESVRDYLNARLTC